MYVDEKQNNMKSRYTLGIFSFKLFFKLIKNYGKLQNNLFAI